MKGGFFMVKNIHRAGRRPLPIPNDLMNVYAIMNTSDMARHYNVSRATISKWLKIQREEVKIQND